MSTRALVGVRYWKVGSLSGYPRFRINSIQQQNIRVRKVVPSHFQLSLIKVSPAIACGLLPYENIRPTPLRAFLSLRSAQHFNNQVAMVCKRVESVIEGLRKTRLKARIKQK